MNKKLKTLKIAIVAVMIAPALTACEKEVIIIEKNKCDDISQEELQRLFRMRLIMNEKKG